MSTKSYSEVSALLEIVKYIKNKIQITIELITIEEVICLLAKEGNLWVDISTYGFRNGVRKKKEGFTVLDVNTELDSRDSLLDTRMQRSDLKS